ncbi:5384_t:CDS:2, partial [Cetraspora pellucida]
MIVRQNGLTVTYPNIKLKMAEILDESAKKMKDSSKKLAINQFKFSTSHIIDQAKAEFCSGNTDLAIIPGGLT